MRDVSRGGHRLGGGRVKGLATRSSLREIIRARITGEVADYNAELGTVFTGLVQPEDSIRHSDGYHMDRPRELDATQLITAAEEAVAAGMLTFRLGEQTVDALDRDITVDEYDEIVAVFERPVIARASG